MKNNKVEVLAPAGSLDICKAVINAGADAVYLGGDLFGARAFAGNLSEKQVIEAIEYAHLRGKAIYLTVNTLLKNHELEQQLFNYIMPYYKAGLDAVIVQDMGVFKKIHDFFPDMPIHASTQMTITGVHGAKLLKRMGATRVVLARELTLSEIASIHQACDIEIESFIHGALCYCYSGQCLLSSMNGARSGNRGRCAQVCRLAYQVVYQHKVLNDKEHAYALSPKDICTLNILPDIIEAGVYALKIEGRMKNVTYAAGVTAMYRKYTDMYLKDGKSGYNVSKEDINYLMDIYNRGEFTTGYYNNSKGRAMMSVMRPNHMGTKALKVKENVNGKVTFQALRAINKHDVFEIDANHSFSSGENVCENGTFVVNLPKKYKLFKGRVIYRTKNAAIADDIEQCYVKDSSGKKAKLDMTLFAECGRNMKLELSALGHTVYVTGDILQKALKNVSDEKVCIEKLSKVGNSSFIAGDIKIVIKGDVFIPSSQLNDIRRRGIDELCTVILKDKQRTFQEANKRNKTENKWIATALSNKKNNRIISVSDTIACNSILTVDKSISFKEIYIDYSICETSGGWELINKLLAQNRHLAVMLSYVTNEKNLNACKERIEAAYRHGIDTFVVRNLEQIGILSEITNNLALHSIKVILDANLYCWNSEAVSQFIEIVCESGLQLERITLPYELNIDEIVEIDWKVPIELIVYGRVPVMLSKQCVKKTYDACDSSNKTVYLNEKLPVSCRCKDCYNIIWSSKILDLTNHFDKINKINPDYIRYDMTEVCTDMIKHKDDSQSVATAVFYNKLLKSILNNNEINSDNIKWTGHFIEKVD